MTDIDVIVLIPWAVASVALILVCARLQISSGGSRRPQQPAGRAQPPGLKPADAQERAPPDPVSAPDAVHSQPGVQLVPGSSID
jgi:hypothetical protein